MFTNPHSLTLTEALTRNSIPLTVLAVVWLLSTYWMLRSSKHPIEGPGFILSWAVSVISLITLHAYLSYPGTMVIWIVILFVYVQLKEAIVRNDEKQTAQELISKRLQIYHSKYESVEVNPKEYPWLDLDFYDKMIPELENYGFIYLKDIEPIYLSRIFPEMRHFIRFFINREKTIWVNVSNEKVVHPKNKFEKKYSNNFISIGCELSDGRFVLVQNNKGVVLSRSTEGIVFLACPNDTSFEKLLQEHSLLLKNTFDEEKISAIQCEGETSAERLHEILRKDMLKNGLYTNEELQELGKQNKYDGPITDYFFTKTLLELSKEKTKELRDQIS